MLNKETAHKALAKLYFDNTKIKKTLPGFTFRPMKETINDTIAAFKASNPYLIGYNTTLKI